MLYEVVPLPFKPHQLAGLSERLLVSHYENDYGGAVQRLNAIEHRHGSVDWAATPVFDLNGLGRERLIATNSMLLHEAYFSGLGGRGSSGEPSGNIASALERDFGSVDRWRMEFSAMGNALAGGSGWVLLTWSDRLGRLTNQWAADHCHTLAGSWPILALDMYEHAYALDFGAKAAAYVDAFMGNIHWERIGARYGRALASERATPHAIARVPKVSVAGLRAMMERGDDIAIVDVCLTEDLPRRTDTLPGARFVAPEAIDDWAVDLPRDKPVIVCCVYGFQVSGDAAAELQRRGYDARTLAGGITAWHAMAGPAVPLTNTQQTGAPK